MDQDNLEDGDIYGNVHKLDDLRLLLTTSQMDKCLTELYPLASRLGNLFHGLSPTPALGAAGPTDKTAAAFGGTKASLSITPGFTIANAASAKAALVVADLTPVHEARVKAKQYDGGLAGSHSDINFGEVYNLVSGFMFS